MRSLSLSVLATALLLLLIPSADADITLDNFSTNQNFVDGKYTFLQGFNSPANNPNVSGGVMNPNFSPGTAGTGIWPR